MINSHSEKRVELKYKVLPHLTQNLLEHVKNITWIKNEFPNRYVHTIYFDDMDMNSCNDNIQGISKRKKIRIRFYYDLHENIELYKKKKIFLEVKKKDNKDTYKKHIQVDVTNKFLKTVTFNNLLKIFVNDDNKHILSNIYPTVYVSYERSYFKLLRGNRMTIDKNIRFSNTNLNKNIFSPLKINYYQNIIELKLYNDCKIPFLFKNWPLTISRHSKYVAGLSLLGKAVYL